MGKNFLTGKVNQADLSAKVWLSGNKRGELGTEHVTEYMAGDGETIYS